jgi:hypothetical protein
MIAKLREYILVLLSFLILTLLLTYPLFRNFSLYLAGDGCDAYNWIWNNWWMKKALIELKTNPFFTDYIIYPHGETLIYHAFTPLYGLLSVPLQYFYSPFKVYNILFIVNFLLTGLGMYVFLRHLTGNRIAAFLGGCIVTFSPYRMAHAYGHFHLLAMEWVPFYLMYLFRTLEEKNKKNIILASLFLALTALNALYYAFYCFVFSVLCVSYFCFQERKLSPLFQLIAIGAGAIFLLSPLAAMAIQHPWKDYLGGHQSEAFSADLLSFFLPSDIQTLGYLFYPLTRNFTAGAIEDSSYLGYAVIFLASYAIRFLWKSNKYVPCFTSLGFIFLILSLGPYLHVGGQITLFPLPTILLDRYFGLSFAGCPVRIHIMTMLCLSVLSSFAVKDIISKGHERWKIFLAGLCAILVLEFLCLPFPVSNSVYQSFKTFSPHPLKPDDGVPEFYKTIAKDNGDYTLLEISLGPLYNRWGQNACYYQTIHQKRLVYGVISRFHSKRFNDLMESPIIRDIALNSESKILKETPLNLKKQLTKMVLNSYKIKYVVVPQSSRHYPINNVPEKVGLCKYFEDDRITVYEICD